MEYSELTYSYDTFLSSGIKKSWWGVGRYSVCVHSFLEENESLYDMRVYVCVCITVNLKLFMRQ